MLLLNVINGSISVLLGQRVMAPFRHHDRVTLFNSTVTSVDLHRTTTSLFLSFLRRQSVYKQANCGFCMTLCVPL